MRTGEIHAGNTILRRAVHDLHHGGFLLILLLQSQHLDFLAESLHLRDELLELCVDCVVLCGEVLEVGGRGLWTSAGAGIQPGVSEGEDS